MKAWMAAAAAVTTMGLAAGAAQAGDVSWTVTVGSPSPRVIYEQPRVVYAPPQVVYAPQPVVVQRVYQPVYQQVYQPVPVVYSVAPGYRMMPPGHAKHWKKHGHKHGYYQGYNKGYRYDD